PLRCGRPSPALFRSRARLKPVAEMDTPARYSFVLQPTAFHSTPIVHLDSPESGYYGTPHLNATNSSYNSSVSSALFSEDGGHSLAAMSSGCAAHPSQSKKSLPRADGQPSMEGRSHVDFLAELQSCSPVLRQILGCLSPRDLAAVCRTSQVWRSVCRSVEEPRWKQYIKARQEHWESSRENIYDGVQTKKSPLCTLPLTDSNSRPSERPSMPRLVESKMEIYAREGKNLRDGESHWPCPVCGYPSRVSNARTVAKCKQPACGYQFCPKCLRDCHLPLPCAVHCVPINSRTKKNIIGGKHSRQQLRRL
ncbi:hypothetical protein V5799_030686, partial [Amblyomma americanum]